jgi:hypothetical protein
MTIQTPFGPPGFWGFFGESSIPGALPNVIQRPGLEPAGPHHPIIVRSGASPMRGGTPAPQSAMPSRAQVPSVERPKPVSTTNAKAAVAAPKEFPMKTKPKTRERSETERRAALKALVDKHSHLGGALSTLFLTGPLSIAEAAISELTTKCPSCGKKLLVSVGSDEAEEPQAPKGKDKSNKLPRPFGPGEDDEAKKAKTFIDQKMGVDRRSPVRRDGTRLVLGVVTPSQAREELARKQRAQSKA